MNMDYFVGMNMDYFVGMNMDYFVGMNRDHLAFGFDLNLVENQIAVGTDFE
jgi:hypothetical protein